MAMRLARGCLFLTSPSLRKFALIQSHYFIMKLKHPIYLILIAGSLLLNGCGGDNADANAASEEAAASNKLAREGDPTLAAYRAETLVFAQLDMNQLMSAPLVVELRTMVEPMLQAQQQQQADMEEANFNNIAMTVLKVDIDNVQRVVVNLEEPEAPLEEGGPERPVGTFALELNQLIDVTQFKQFLDAMEVADQIEDTTPEPVGYGHRVQYFDDASQMDIGVGLTTHEGSSVFYLGNLELVDGALKRGGSSLEGTFQQAQLQGTGKSLWMSLQPSDIVKARILEGSESEPEMTEAEREQAERLVEGMTANCVTMNFSETIALSLWVEFENEALSTEFAEYMQNMIATSQAESMASGQPNPMMQFGNNATVERQGREVTTFTAMTEEEVQQLKAMAGFLLPAMMMQMQQGMMQGDAPGLPGAP